MSVFEVPTEIEKEWESNAGERRVWVVYRLSDPAYDWILESSDCEEAAEAIRRLLRGARILGKSMYWEVYRNESREKVDVFASGLEPGEQERTFVLPQRF